MVPQEAPLTTAIAEPKRPIGPIRPKNRIETIDILRGFALFGVIMANTWGFQSWSLPWTIQFEEVWTGAADHVAMWGITFFVEGRFYRLFSFLFGLGIALQLGRAEQRGAPFFAVYRRRMLVLLCRSCLSNQKPERC